MSTAVTTQPDAQSPRAIDVFKRQLEKASATITPLLPAHVTPEKFQAMVITTVAYNPKLQDCTPASLLQSVATLAELGLSTNPNLKEADILPVWSKDGTVAQARPRYTGLMKLARQGGDIVDIYAHAVFEKDEFEYEYGLDKRLVHRPASGDRGELTFAYCVWKTRDGERGFEVVDKKRIERAKNASEGYKAFKAGKIKSTPWVDHEEEMWRKTAVRAGAKFMPQATENEAFRKALALDDDVAFDEHMPQVAASETPAISAPKPTRASVRDETERARKQAYEMDKQYRETMGDAPSSDAPDADDSPQYPTGEMATNIAETEVAAYTLVTDAKGTVQEFDTLADWEAAAIYRVDNNKPAVVAKIAQMNESHFRTVATIDKDAVAAVKRVMEAFARKCPKHTSMNGD